MLQVLEDSNEGDDTDTIWKPLLNEIDVESREETTAETCRLLKSIN